MKQIKHFATILFIILISSCVDNQFLEEITPELEIVGISNVQNVTCSESELVITIKSNVDWEITTDNSSWVHFNKLSGKKGEEKINILIAPNTSEDPRRSSFIITAKGKEEKFTLIQAKFVKLDVPTSLSVNGIDGNTIIFENSGGEKNFEIIANYPWTIDVTNISFVAIQPQQGDAGKETVIIRVEENKKQERLEGFLVVSCKEIKDTLHVIQNAAPDPAVIIVDCAEVNNIDYRDQNILFKVRSNYDWNINSEDDSWMTITPRNGKGNEDVEVKIAVSENKSDKRTGKFTITSRESAKTITIVQDKMSTSSSIYDSHSVGFVFFEDDFSWVTTSWNSTYPKYGWVSAKTNGTHNNEYPVNNVESAKTEADKLGYICDACCYAKAEGFIKLGKSSQLGYIETPSISSIDPNTIASLSLFFKSGLYCSAAKTPDTYQYIQVSIIGEGEILACGTENAIIANDRKSIEIPLQDDEAHIWRWTEKNVIIQKANSNTKIRFGSSDNKKGRCFIDDIKLIRIDDANTQPNNDSISEPALDFTLSIDENEVVSNGGDIGALLRVNRDFTVISDSPWLTINQIAYATSASGINKDGIVISEDKLSASISRTAMPYNKTIFSVAPNDTPIKRTATVSVKVGEQIISDVKVVQEAKSFNISHLAKWSWTGLVAGGGLDDVVTNWISGNHTYLSDAVTGGIFSAYIQGNNAVFSIGTSSQKKDRLRINKMSVNDYFQFSVSNVTAKTGDIIRFSGVGVATTSITTGPVNWIEEYSLDNGNTWVKIREISIKAGSKPVDLGCEISLTDSMSKGDIRIRVRIVNNLTSNGEFVDGNSNIGMIMLYEDDKVTSNNNHYTDDWAYATISLLQK